MKNNVITKTSAKFGSVRCIEEKNGIVYCASDIAKALGYSNSRKAVIDHCKGVTKRDTLTAKGIQKLSYIPEPDVYRLICHSKLPSAIEFEKWVFEDVVPKAVREQTTPQPEPECEQLTLETSEYHYFNKTYKGQPVLGTTDIEHLAGISSGSIGWYIREKGFINGVDYFLLNGQQMADFKAENPMVSRLTVEMYVITKSGFEKLMKLSGRRCEKPKCFIEQKKTAPAPQKWVTADECITALNVLSWIKDYCTHEVEENKASGDKMASRYEKTLSACNDIIKQVGMMIAAS